MARITTKSTLSQQEHSSKGSCTSPGQRYSFLGHAFSACIIETTPAWTISSKRGKPPSTKRSVYQLYMPLEKCKNIHEIHFVLPTTILQRWQFLKEKIVLKIQQFNQHILQFAYLLRTSHRSKVGVSSLRSGAGGKIGQGCKNAHKQVKNAQMHKT